MLQESPTRMPPWIRERFPPDQRSAVDYLRSQIDEGMLREIAEADYAQDTEEHLAALKPIWHGDELRELHYWFPDEVLRLIRWSEPDDSERNPGPTRSRGHKMRAFSCAVLLATPNFEPDKETLIQLLDSVKALGPEAQEATARFLVWQLDTLGSDEDRPFFALALVAIVQSLEDSCSSSMEQDLADWVSHEQASVRSYLAGFNDTYRTAPWLFGLSFNDMRNYKWETLIRAVRERSGLKPLGRMLTENYKAEQADAGSRRSGPPVPDP